MSLIAEHLDIIRQGIADAEKRAHRPLGSVKLLAVTKTFPVEDIREAYDAGQRLFAENKVQEILTKAPLLPDDVEWHLIGPLQRNKVRKILPLARVIHAVDSLKLAQYIDDVATELDLTPHILFEVNVGDEDSKFGFSPDELRSSWKSIMALKHVRSTGLMCIPPPTEDEETARSYFRLLRDLRDELERDGLGVGSLPELSMGMSHDYSWAIEEGATMVRVGTAIFGGRPAKATSSVDLS